MPAFDIAACAALLDELTALGVRAAQAIKDCSDQGSIRSKADGSPVTAADEAAETVICDGLKRLAPGVITISEEQAARKMPKPPLPPESGEATSYFLVDPLDGTREFIAGRDEYTVNIALVSGGVPILGVIAAPAFGLIWRGAVGRGAERIVFAEGKSSSPIAIHARPRSQHALVVMISRSHLDPRTRAYLDGFPQAKLVQSGSSIKFCRLAEGVADLYPRLGPTHDWDIAAGHAILKAAGGEVTAPDGSPIVYGNPDFLIPEFLASGAPLMA